MQIALCPIRRFQGYVDQRDVCAIIGIVCARAEEARFQRTRRIVCSGKNSSCRREDVRGEWGGGRGGSVPGEYELPSVATDKASLKRDASRYRRGIISYYYPLPPAIIGADAPSKTSDAVYTPRDVRRNLTNTRREKRIITLKP